MEQTPLTIFVPIKPDCVEALRTYLKAVGDDIAKTSEIKLNEYDALHYCAWIILEEKSKKLPCQPVLVFEGNIDGDIPSFLKTLVQQDAAFLRKVYTHCQGYSEDFTEKDLLAYLTKHRHSTNTFYVAHPSRTKTDILRENHLYNRIQDFISQERESINTLSPSQAHQYIAEYINTQPDMDWVHTPHITPWRVRNQKLISKYFFKVLGIIGLLALAIIFFAVRGTFGEVGKVLGWLALITLVLFILAALYLFFVLEKNDKQATLKWDRSQLNHFQAFEDRQKQNHLSSITYVKPGLIRYITLAIVLWFVNLSATLIATHGKLSGIVTIHFARWVLIKGVNNEPHRLLFFSNYDGSWENYLGEFIDQASLGLSAIWSNTQADVDKGFPDSRFLGLKGGARNEQLFKAYARNSQMHEGIWYSAYTDISVKNVENHAKVRDGLFTVGDNSEEWLSRF